MKQKKLKTNQEVKDTKKHVENGAQLSNGKQKQKAVKELELDENNMDTNSMAYIFTKKNGVLALRTSLLDDIQEGSILNKSIFRGFYNCTMVFGLVFFITYPILNKIQYGSLVQNQSFMPTMSKDLWLCLLSWPIFYTWSFNAFFLQKFIIWGLNKRIAQIYQHTTQLLMFIYSMYMILNNYWCLTHSGFMSMLACTHFMKMHSYTMVNFDYRTDVANSKAKGHSPVSDLYPKNITFWNFNVYMWMPILVYQDEFPRTQVFRLGYFVRKFFQTMFGVVICYIIAADFIIPQVEKGESRNVVELICSILLPMTIFTIVLFFTVWEAMCNAFAEITYFGDREFYRDWWNCTTFQEFNSKWNKCVYNFLFRHVYLECYFRLKWNKTIAQLTTFLFSALLHEWILILVFKIVRPIITLCIMQQIPLFYLTNGLNKSRAGNLLMWFGMLAGVPFIGVNYLKSHPEVTILFSPTGILENQTLFK